MTLRRTIGASDNPAVLGGVRAKNNGRYNGNGRHWETPPEVFDPLNAEFRFTLDPCQPGRSDGLTRSWAGETVFCNPPYRRGQIEQWLAKAGEAISVVLSTATVRPRRFCAFVISCPPGESFMN